MSAIITIDRTQIVGIPAGNGAIFSAATPSDIATTLGNQTANKFYSGPVTGAASAPAFRAINSTDLGYTATGQILYNRSDGAMTPLTIGSSGQVLTVAGGVPTYATPTTGTVTAVSVATANGLAGSSSGGATPALTLTTTITGVLKGNGTAISAGVNGTDYSAGTASLITGLVKSTTGTGALTIGTAGTDFSMGTASLATGIVKSTTATGALTIAVAADLPPIGSSGQVTYNNAGVMAGATNMTYAGGSLLLGATSSTATLAVQSSASNVVLDVRGFNTGQAANLQTWTNSNGTVEASIDSQGNLTAKSAIVASIGGNSVSLLTIGQNARTIIQTNAANTIVFDAGMSQDTIIRPYSSSFNIQLAPAGGKVLIGTSTGTNDLSFGSAAARKMWIENSATDVVGRALTVAAGGTVAGTSVNDVTGGNLVIQSGLGTGTSSSMISFQTGAALTTGKVLQTMTEQFQVFSGGVVSRGVVRLKGYTVATLPTGTQGDTAFCTDLLTPTFLTTAVGGGAIVGPVFFDGTNWKSY